MWLKQKNLTIILATLEIAATGGLVLPATYNAFFPGKCVIGPGRDGRITRKGRKNALLLRQRTTNLTIKEVSL